MASLVDNLAALTALTRLNHLHHHTTLHYCRLVEYNRRNSPLPSLSNAPTVGDTASEAPADKPVAVQADDGDNDDNYDGLDFKRVPYPKLSAIVAVGQKAGSTATAGPSGTASTRRTTGFAGTAINDGIRRLATRLTVLQTLADTS
jgi:hypothetical protein